MIFTSSLITPKLLYAMFLTWSTLHYRLIQNYHLPYKYHDLYFINDHSKTIICHVHTMISISSMIIPKLSFTMFIPWSQFHHWSFKNYHLPCSYHNLWFITHHFKAIIFHVKTMIPSSSLTNPELSSKMSIPWCPLHQWSFQKHHLYLYIIFIRWLKLLIIPKLTWPKSLPWPILHHSSFQNYNLSCS